jgi:site-specific recombinase XerD
MQKWRPRQECVALINRAVTRWTRRHLGVRLAPHKLCHAYGKHCVDRGVDIRIIAEALGHDSLESTKIYTQVSFERTRRIAELFALRGANYLGANPSTKSPA